MNHVANTLSSAMGGVRGPAFTAEAGDLRAACNHLRHVIEARHYTSPMLACVHLAMEDDGAVLTGTNLDMSLSVRVDGEPTTNGAALLVPFAILRRALEGAAADGEVALFIDGAGGAVLVDVDSENRMRIDCDIVEAPEDWPTEPGIGKVSHEIDLSADEAHTLLRPAWAMAREDEDGARYYLCGLYLHATETSLRSVATNGHRLATVEVDAPDGADGMPGWIMPRRAVTAWRAVMPGRNANNSIRVTVGEHGAIVAVGDARLVMRFVAGKYPDYASVIPKEFEGTAVLPRRRLGKVAHWLRRICGVGVRNGRTKIALTWERHRVCIAAGAFTLEGRTKASTVMPADCGAALSGRVTGFNSAYLREAVGAFTGDDLVFRFSGGNESPVLLTDPDDPALRVVLMPMWV